MRARTGWIAALVTVLLPQVNAYAWHDAGHAAVASIAWKNLSGPGDQKTREQIVKLLKQHHDYETMWEPKVAASGVDEGEYLLMHAALWPDDIRPPTDPMKPKPPSNFFHQPTWHYKDYAYIPQGQPMRSLAAGGEDAEAALKRAQETLKVGSIANATSKSIALCWLAHLAGDVHQPLHAATLMSNDFDKGDRGGNLFLIQHAQKNLHSYWDGVFDAKTKDLEWSQLAQAITTDPHLTIGALQAKLGMPFQYGKWLDESHGLAVENAYNFHGAVLKPGIKDDPAHPAQPLPPGYDANAETVCRERIALAGYRLAAMLRLLFPPN